MKVKLTLVAVAVSFLLAGCGGGGGGDSTGNTPTGNVPTTPPIVTPPVVTPPVTTPTSDLQVTVPAPSYVAGSQELAFFNALNDFRSKSGLGLLAQNAKLDSADQNHVKYLLSNLDVDLTATDPKTGRPFFHIEDPARSNYTGATELDRANFVQYGGPYVGEFGGYGLGKGASVALADLIATVYHRDGLMFQGPRDVGIAVGTDTNQTFVVTYGYTKNQQSNASNFFGSYPADKQQGVPLVMRTEVPNPLADVALADYSTKTSYPINVVSQVNTTLTVTAFTVTEAGQSVAVDSRLLTKATDPNKQLGANTAYLVGKVPFKANTTYNVRFEGSINGVSVSKTWSFTTGS